MSRKRIVLLGIDGMDYELTCTFLNVLPNIKRLWENGIVAPFQSVFPPDSIPSWITAYTGLDPSEHGIVESVDYLAKDSDNLNKGPSFFRGKTFWDVLGQAQIKVCVINPFMAYPVWPVNGVMINGPVFINKDVQVSDYSWVHDIPVPQSLGGITDFPTNKTLKQFLDKALKDTRDQVEFGVRMIKKNQPHFFFQTFLSIDRIQHFFWRFCDQNDPTWPGVNKFQHTLRDLYIYADQIIGRFSEVIEPGDQLIVISDHGHERRCTHCFNINEYFRRKGHVISNAEGKVFSAAMIGEKFKNRFLKYMSDYNLEDYIPIIAKYVPYANAIKKGKLITNSSKNKAYASEFTGTNPFGGIRINKRIVKGYEDFRGNLIEELKAIHYCETPIFEWLCPREELFNGPYVSRFPDILFKMKSWLGINWALHTDLFTVNPTHKKISGGHGEIGVLLMNKPSNIHVDKRKCRIINLFPSILEFYGIAQNDHYKSKSFLTVTER